MRREIESTCYITEDIDKIKDYSVKIYAGNLVTIKDVYSSYYYVRDENNGTGFNLTEEELQDDEPKAARELCKEFDIDYDSLHDEIKQTYNEYGHACSDSGIDELLRHFFLNKRNLIKLIQKHPNYNGNLQIVSDVVLERFSDDDEIECVIKKLEKTDFGDIFKIRINEEGKTKEEVFSESVEKLESFYDISEIEEVEFEAKAFPSDTEFNSLGYFLKPLNIRDGIRSFLDGLCEGKIGETVDDRILSLFEECLGDYVTLKSEKITLGMKTSRAINRLFMDIAKFKTLAKDDYRLKDYNSCFAQFSDMINPKKQMRRFVISVNPLDYLKMSFGNTWSSCHTIDSKNIRGNALTSRGTSTYTGMHMGGTISYMLDEVSAVSYMVLMDSDSKHPDRSDKIYRNMFHFQNNVLVQGRMYPQSKDGCVDLYTFFRHLIQEHLCTCLGIEYVENGGKGDTWIKKGQSTSYSTCFNHYGAHYADTSNFEDCNISYINGFWHNDFSINIGSYGICANCGNIISEYGEISHDDCEERR